MEQRIYNLLKSDNNHICPICREFIPEFKDSLILPCGHLYCKNCFTEYYKVYNNCSLCKQQFNCLDHSRLLRYLESFDIQCELYEIIYLYFNIDSLIIQLLNNCDWQESLSNSTNYFDKSQINLFIKQFLKVK